MTSAAVRSADAFTPGKCPVRQEEKSSQPEVSLRLSLEGLTVPENGLFVLSILRDHPPPADASG